MSFQCDLYRPTRASAVSLSPGITPTHTDQLVSVNVHVHPCICVYVLRFQGGKGDMYKVWHLIWRREHVHWSCCVEALRAQLLIPLGPTEVYTLPDYMSGLVSPAKQAPGCLQWHPILFHACYQLYCFQPFGLGMIQSMAKDCLSVSACTRAVVDWIYFSRAA